MSSWISDLSGSEGFRGESPEDAAFCTSSGCAGWSPDGGRSAAGAPEPGSCVLVGPPGSGKTSFLASLGRAFELERSAEWTRFVAGLKLTSLMNSPPAMPDANREAPPSSGTPWSTYSFQFGVRLAEAGAGVTTITKEMEVTVLDTPGCFFEALAGEGSSKIDRDQVQDLIRAARNARCLVLCVDAGDKRGDLQVGLVSFASRFLGLGPRRLQRVDAKPWPARESPWERAHRLELPFERVLVLLTCIETLCSDVARRLARVQMEWTAAPPTEIRSLAAYQGLSAWDIAELLDLWPLAKDRIDGLDLLASCLKPDALLAVCGVSAVGVERTPPNVQGDASDPPEAGNRLQSLSFGLGEPKPVRRLSPFGIWPSLLFMTTGRVVAPLMTINRNWKSAAPPQWRQLHELPGEGQ
jgi:hypothetical protein